MRSTRKLIPALMAGGLLAAGLGLVAAPQAKAETLHLMAKSSFGTLDPHINYETEAWQLSQSVYDGLLAFKKTSGKAGTEIVPDLAAAMPTVSNGGKTYVFTIRKGVTFSNGKELGVADVVASLQRIFKVSGPTAGSFFNVIVGADACLKTPATCTLAGGVIGDEKAGTVTINLTQPDAEFFDKLSIPHSFILPAETPAKDMGNTPIPGTGTYMFKSYDPNKGIVLVRNPNFKEWSKDAQPTAKADEIDYDFGLDVEAQVTAVENGQADWTYEDIPADRLGELGAKYAKQVHINLQAAYFYVSMNVNIAPFNNEKARLAVNYAIDRKAVVKIYGGPRLALPTCQVLPPNFPGYEAYCPFTKNPGAKWTAPDMAKAKELMKESGMIGQPVVINTRDSTVWAAFGTYLQGVLNNLGFKATVKQMPFGTQYTYINNSKNNVQFALTDWFQDYPAPSDFLYVLYSCAGFIPGSDSSTNTPGFCDKDIDAQMNQAKLIGVTDPAKANVLWAKIDKAVTDKSSTASLITPKKVDFVSKRLEGFVFNPVYNFLPQLASVQ
jgi:peptide/nickel transport system substrate-binding protein